MILTDYYKYQRLPNHKSNQRLDCVASKGGYTAFDVNTHIYIGVGDYVKANRNRQGDLKIKGGKIVSGTNNHLTTIFHTDLKNGFAYGDMKGTTDLLLFVFHNFSINAEGRIADGAIIEVFVARGRKYDRNQINNLFLDGELDAEMEHLRQSATSGQNQ